MSEASKRFQHQASKKGVHLGSRIICGSSQEPIKFDGLLHVPVYSQPSHNRLQKTREAAKLSNIRSLTVQCKSLFENDFILN